jgi:hypothetical protein
MQHRFILPVVNEIKGIIPGIVGTPLGQITLPVTFGREDNFRMEMFLFEVIDLEMPYNTIFGRPLLAQFLAIPHETNLMMKIPEPTGVITL